jgi:hypothetical protein
MTRLPLALACLLTGCANLEVTALLGPRTVEGESEPGAFLMIARPIGKHGLCSYLHTSNPARGVPFNDKPSVEIDGGMCGWRWGR